MADPIHGPKNGEPRTAWRCGDRDPRLDSMTMVQLGAVLKGLEVSIHETTKDLDGFLARFSAVAGVLRERIEIERSQCGEEKGTNGGRGRSHVNSQEVRGGGAS